jgi:hypothetical protein
MVTDAQYNAGRILINVKMGELGKLHKKLLRLRALNDRIIKCREMPYTDENMSTLLVYSMAALCSGNWLMMVFWLDATTQVAEDIQHCIKIEHLRQHQANRIGNIAEKIGSQVLALGKEIKAIQNRIGG